MKVVFLPVLSIFFIRYDLIICVFTQICTGFKITLWWTNLFLSVPHMFFLNIFFYIIYAVIFLNSFLVLHILWSIFRCRWSSSLLDLVDLSFHFLCYILIFSSTGVLYSPSNHPRQRGASWCNWGTGHVINKRIKFDKNKTKFRRISTRHHIPNTWILLSLLLHRAFWRFTEYCTPTNALIVYHILV